MLVLLAPLGTVLGVSQTTNDNWGQNQAPAIASKARKWGKILAHAVLSPPKHHKCYAYTIFWFDS